MNVLQALHFTSPYICSRVPDAHISQGVDPDLRLSPKIMGVQPSREIKFDNSKRNSHIFGKSSNVNVFLNVCIIVKKLTHYGKAFT